MKSETFREVNLCMDCFKKKATWLYDSFEIKFLGGYNSKIRCLCVDCAKRYRDESNRIEKAEN